MKELRDRRRKELTAETPQIKNYHAHAEEILSLYVQVSEEFFDEFDLEEKESILNRII